MENTTHTNADQTAQTTSPPPSIKDAPLQRAGSVKSTRSHRSTNDVPISTSPEKRVTVRSARLNRDSLPPSFLHGDPILGSENGGHPKPLTIFQCLKLVLLSSKINVLLVFIPLGIVSGHVHWSDVTVFILNFIAIIPLAKLLGFVTEEISLRLGENLGALLNASFGNAVELILSIIALKEDKIDVVKASIIGSILSNLLLVLGFCFLAGGYKYKSQTFNQTAAQTSASLLALSCMSLLIPAAFIATASESIAHPDVKNLSHGTAIVLLVVYVLYLWFQLKTHEHLYATEAEEEEVPLLPLWLGIILLLGITVLVALCAESLVGSIEGLSTSWDLTHTFIGLILLPIVGNAAEHATAVTVAMKNKMDLAIGVAIGSSMQIALFVSPLMVIIGWGLSKDMDLFFGIFETSVMFISVLIVNYLIQDGESNWLEGIMLLSTYVIVAIAIFYLPDPVSTGGAVAGHAAKAIAQAVTGL
ncbi:calcium/proton exchanger [Linnemannia elongata AG-77]|uniref:Vacuolar calcium ion transporter n=1 Tax=Linnemannia elongata AG-77 TaxID=1314771 RepID=A0A197KEU5_9FUNG|nr:calcium/proton exchanger [Linnemannia elongata AG-77]